MDSILVAIAPQLATVAGVILLGLATWGIALLKSKVKFDVGKTALDEVDRAIKAVVGNLNQTVVGELKAMSADGKWTEAEKAKVKRVAINEVHTLLSTEVTASAEKIMTDLAGYITREIEKQVLASKPQKPTVVLGVGSN